MAQGQRKRRTRAVSLYPNDDRNILNAHKEEFRKETSADARKRLFRHKVLVDIFNHWESRGKAPQNEEESAAQIKKLWSWVTNNWRPYATLKAGSGPLKITVREVVRRTRKEAIHDELKAILGVDDLDPSSPECFQQHNKALTAVTNRLQPDELKELQKVATEWSNQGYPESERRRNGDKQGFKIIRASDRQRWLEMGMVSLTMVAWTDVDGVLSVRTHDNIATNMGVVGAQNFESKCPTLVDEMTRKFSDYVVGLHRALTPDAFSTHITPISLRPDHILKFDENGFPILPEQPSDVPLLKVELEQIIRNYLNAHYKLASGNTKERAPWGAIERNADLFIPAEYLPPVTLKEPRGMQGDAIHQALEFWREREAKYGPSEAVKFTYYINGRRETVPAQYGDRGDQHKAVAAAAAKKKNRKRAKTARVPAPEHDEEPSILVTPTPPRDVAPIATSDIAAETNSPPAELVGNPSHMTTPETLRTLPDITPGVDCPDGASSSDTECPIHSQSLADGLPLPVGFSIVDEQIVQRLRDKGISIPLPVNGPDDGLPRYIVPTSAVESLVDHAEPPVPDGDKEFVDERRVDVNRKRKASTGKGSSRKKARSDDLIIKEAMDFTGNRSLRSNRATGDQGINTRASARLTRKSGRS